IDAPFFFGRETLSARIAHRVNIQPFVAVVGSSGSGKSSVVSAGVFPILRKSVPPSPTWEIVTFTPGSRPFHRLAASLTSLRNPGLTDTERLLEAQKLGDAFQTGLIRIEDYAEEAILQTDVTDRVLLFADQFEELFTM